MDKRKARKYALMMVAYEVDSLIDSFDSNDVSREIIEALDKIKNELLTKANKINDGTSKSKRL